MASSEIPELRELASVWKNWEHHPTNWWKIHAYTRMPRRRIWGTLFQIPFIPLDVKRRSEASVTDIRNDWLLHYSALCYRSGHLWNVELTTFRSTNPYAPCMVYLPTFGSFMVQMLVNIPYMEHMGNDRWSMIISWSYWASNLDHTRMTTAGLRRRQSREVLGMGTTWDKMRSGTLW